jgi:hypothetical protein
MTTVIFALDLDQQRCEKQSAIALELFIDGEGDAYDGVRPASLDLAYMTGYSQGVRRKLVEMQHQADLLEAEGLAVEAIFGEEIPF